MDEPADDVVDELDDDAAADEPSDDAVANELDDAVPEGLGDDAPVAMMPFRSAETLGIEPLVGVCATSNVQANNRIVSVLSEIAMETFSAASFVMEPHTADSGLAETRKPMIKPRTFWWIWRE